MQKISLKSRCFKKKGIFSSFSAANEISPREKLALTQLMPYAWTAILQKINAT